MYWFYLSLIVITFVFGSCQTDKYAAEVSNHHISLNYLIDECLADLQKALKKFGYDPMVVPSVQYNTSVKIAFIERKLKLNLTDGVVVGLSEFKRQGNSYTKFLPYTLRFRANVHVDELYGNFNYSYDTILSDKGVLNASIENVTALLQVDYQLNTGKLAYPKLKIKHIGNVQVNMDSDASFAWLRNVVANFLIVFFKTEIIKTAESSFLKIANENIDHINNNMHNITTEVITQLLTNYQPD